MRNPARAGLQASEAVRRVRRRPRALQDAQVRLGPAGIYPAELGEVVDAPPQAPWDWADDTVEVEQVHALSMVA